jgi:hypothetical protein
MSPTREFINTVSHKDDRKYEMKRKFQRLSLPSRYSCLLDRFSANYTQIM